MGVTTAWIFSRVQGSTARGTGVYTVVNEDLSTELTPQSRKKTAVVAPI
jgi:hypothetical protein